jgi:hypothetical protein
MGDKCIQGFEGGKKTLGRPTRRLKDNIKMGLKIGRKGVDWIHLAHN